MDQSTPPLQGYTEVSISPLFCAGNGLEGLCQEFPQYDPALLEEMLQDQEGDAEEVHACLRVSCCPEFSNMY